MSHSPTLLSVLPLMMTGPLLSMLVTMALCALRKREAQQHMAGCGACVADVQQ